MASHAGYKLGRAAVPRAWRGVIGGTEVRGVWWGLYFLIRRGEIRERERHRQGFLVQVRERYLQLLAGFHRGEQVGAIVVPA